MLPSGKVCSAMMRTLEEQRTVLVAAAAAVWTELKEERTQVGQ